MDLRVFPLPEGLVHVESDEDHMVFNTVNDMGLNLAVLSLQTLHALHHGVSNELKIREQHALTVISEFKVNNEQLFREKTQALKEQEELQTRRQNLVTTIEQACKSVPEMNIPDNAEASAKVRKLAATVRASKEKVDKVTFDVQMQITEMQLKLQLITLPEVREQRGATIKESMAQLHVAVQGCDQLFTQAMGLWDTLQENPTL